MKGGIFSSVEEKVIFVLLYCLVYESWSAGMFSFFFLFLVRPYVSCCMKVKLIFLSL